MSSSTPVAPASAVALTPAEIAVTAENALSARPVREPWRIAMLAILGGAWIGLGFVFYITSQTGGADVPFGLLKVVGGVVFSVGLLLVVVTGAELFTSTSMTIISLLAHRVTAAQFIKHWVIVWVFNFIGALGVAAMVYYGDVYNNAKGAWGKVVLDGAATKLHHDIPQTIVLAIFANLAVCLAVWMAFAAKTVTDKAIACVGPVALFVSTGLEHSIANMFFLPLAVILKNGGSEKFLAGLDMAKYADITWGNVLMHNILPVTFGNIIGGGLIAGVYQWYANKPKADA